MQVKENVNASNLLLVGVQTVNPKQSVNPAPSTENKDFASYLEQSGKTSDKNMEVKESQPVSQTDSKEPKQGYTEQKVEKEEPVAEQQVEVKQNAAADTEEPVNAEIPELPEEEAVELLSVVNQVMQMLMDYFQLTPEQLTDKIAEFEIELKDLVTAGGIKEFFLQMEHAEPADLLTNEELAQNLTDVMNEFDQILQESDLTETDLTAVFDVLEAEQPSMDVEELQEVITKVVTQLKEEVPQPEKLPQQKESVPQLKETAQQEVVETSPDDEPEVVVTGKRQPDTNPNDSQDNNTNPGVKEQEPQVYQAKREVTVSHDKPQFENPILQAIQKAVEQIDELELPKEQPVRGEEIIKQIVEQVRVNMNMDNTSMEMQLYPQHLGKIQINVIAKDGIMTARIVAETEAAKQAIEGGLSNLKESMQQQNLKVEAIEVMVSTTGFEQRDPNQGQLKQNQASGKGRKLRFSDADEEAEQEDVAEVERMRASGSSVSYIA